MEKATKGNVLIFNHTLLGNYSVRKILQEAGYNVIRVDSDFMKYVHEIESDLVIVDALPKETYSILNEIETVMAEKGLAVIIISDNKKMPERLVLKDNMYWINRPIDKSKLITLIDKALFKKKIMNQMCNQLN